MAAMMTIWQPQSSVVPKKGIPGVRSKYVRDDTKSVLVLVVLSIRLYCYIEQYNRACASFMCNYSA